MTKKNTAKRADDDFQRLVEGAVAKAFDLAKTTAVVGIKSAFAAKNATEQVESGATEERLRQGVAEMEKAFTKGVRLAKKKARRFLRDLLADETESTKKSDRP